VRGGGTLMVEFTRDGSLPLGTWDPRIDGRAVDPFGGPIAVTPGASITIPRGLQHRFWGKAGTGTVFAAEVSQCNDDRNDNFFLEPLGRFSTVEEDEAALLPLWNEVTR
jgi:D-lyxose ketol-isomerase